MSPPRTFDNSFITATRAANTLFGMVHHTRGSDNDLCSLKLRPGNCLGDRGKSAKKHHILYCYTCSKYGVLVIMIPAFFT